MTVTKPLRQRSAAEQVRRQRAERHQRKHRVQPHPEPPAQPGTTGRPRTHRRKRCQVHPPFPPHAVRIAAAFS